MFNETQALVDLASTFPWNSNQNKTEIITKTFWRGIEFAVAAACLVKLIVRNNQGLKQCGIQQESGCCGWAPNAIFCRSLCPESINDAFVTWSEINQLRQSLSTTTHSGTVCCLTHKGQMRQMRQTRNTARHFILQALLRDLETFPDWIAVDLAITRMLDAMRVLLKLNMFCCRRARYSRISNPCPTVE